jgi:hypothetical protein
MKKLETRARSQYSISRKWYTHSFKFNGRNLKLNREVE